MLQEDAQCCFSIQGMLDVKYLLWGANKFKTSFTTYENFT